MKPRDGIHTELNIFTFFRLSRYKIVVLGDREKQKITVYIQITDIYQFCCLHIDIY